MKTIKVYQFKELSKKAKEYAINQYRNKNHEIFWQDETIKSLKGLFEHCNSVRIKNYSLGEYNSWLQVEFNREEEGQLSGKRAVAWLENNLLTKLRYKAGIDNIKKRVFVSNFVKSINHPQGAFIHQIGDLKECAFTGYCADDDFLDDLIKEVKQGADLKTAFEGLAITYQKIIQGEIEYQNSDEYIAETLEANEYDFMEDGERI